MKFKAYRKPAFLIAIVIMASCAGKATESVPDSADKTVTAAEDSVMTAEPTRATLYFVGDAMQHKGQLRRAMLLDSKEGDFSTCFSLIAPIAEAADYAIVNLETPLGGRKAGYSGYPCFSAPDSYANALKDAGFDLFLTSNNHSLDRGDAGVRRTIAMLDSMKVDHVGSYANKAERRVKVPFIKNIKGIKIAFLNYTYGTNGIRAKKGAEVSLINRKAIREEIAAAKAAGADLICVCIHWGIEYQLNESKTQQNLAQFLAEEGVDLIIGGHPHVVQPMKIINNRRTGKKILIVYSLGNFVSDMKKTNTRGGGSVTCVVEKDAEGETRLVDAYYDTFFVEKPSGRKDNFRVVPSAMADCLPADQRREWNEFSANAEKTLGMYGVRRK